MGFFSELKSDLSQAVNTLMPEDKPEAESKGSNGPVEAPKPVVPPVAETPAPVSADSTSDLADIAKSLAEINKTLKALLTILNK